MGEVEIIVAVPGWLADSLAELASKCEKSIDYIAGSFFAAEVVHTQDRKALPFCPVGGTHRSTQS